MSRGANQEVFDVRQIVTSGPCVRQIISVDCVRQYVQLLEMKEPNEKRHRNPIRDRKKSNFEAIRTMQRNYRGRPHLDESRRGVLLRTTTGSIGKDKEGIVSTFRTKNPQGAKNYETESKWPENCEQEGAGAVKSHYAGLRRAVGFCFCVARYGGLQWRYFYHDQHWNNGERQLI